MKNAFLIRNEFFQSCIRGILIAGEKKFYTLELPWRNNQTNISCIPEGQYETEFLLSSASGKYHDVYHILDVPSRGGILIHNGNVVEHTHGCIIIGYSLAIMAGKPAVSNSRSALAAFIGCMEKKSFTLQIIGA